MEIRSKRPRVDYEEVHPIKLTKCYICAKVSDNLIELPFEKHICDECIDYKCANEFRSPDEVNQLIDLINPVGILFDQMQKQWCAPSSSHFGIQLFKIKSRGDDLRSKMKNYEAKIRVQFDSIRMEIDQGYKRVERAIDGWCQLSYHQLIQFSDQVKANYESNQREYDAMVESFLNQNAIYISHLIGQIERYGYLDGYVLKNYENELNQNLKSLALLPNKNRTVEFVPATSNPDISIGSIKINGETRPASSSKMLSSSFSMNSILGIQSSESKQRVSGYKLKSVHSLLDNQNKDKFLIFYEWLDESFKYKIVVYDHQGSKQSETLLNETKRIYAIGTDLISKLVICKKGQSDSSVELCISEGSNFAIKRKVDFHLKDGEIPVDVCFQNFIGVLVDQGGDQFKIALFDLNLRNIHSIRIHINQPRELLVKTKMVFKNNLACMMFSLSTSSSFIKCVDLITGRSLFQFQVNLIADTILICHSDEQTPDDDKVKIYNETNSSELKIIFVSGNTFYLYDMSLRRVVFSTTINNEHNKTTTTTDLVTVNRKGELVSLNIC